jgi:uncharacterized damage-inducible protein DinB
MNADYVRRLSAHGWWIRDQLLLSARALDDREYRAANGFSHGSIAGTLWHIQLVESGWSERFSGRAWPSVSENSPPALADLARAWQDQEVVIRTWLATLCDEDLQRPIGSRRFPMWASITHLAFHTRCMQAKPQLR